MGVLPAPPQLRELFRFQSGFKPTGAEGRALFVRLTLHIAGQTTRRSNHRSCPFELWDPSIMTTAVDKGVGERRPRMI
jgi:hypothetical protein